MSSVLKNSTFFSFRLITSPSQLSYVSVTVKRNFSSKHGIINRLNIPYKSTKSWYLDPTKDYIKSTKLLSTYETYLKYLIYRKYHVSNKLNTERKSLHCVLNYLKCWLTLIFGSFPIIPLSYTISRKQGERNWDET